MIRKISGNDNFDVIINYNYEKVNSIDILFHAFFYYKNERKISSEAY